MGEKIIAIVTFRDLHTDSCKFSTTPMIQEKNEIFSVMEKNNKFQSLKTLRNFLSDKIAFYKTPQDLFIVESIPRNHLGKV